MKAKDTIIRATANHDAFHRLDCNRSVVERHVRHLAALIEANDELHLNPIVVTPDMGIIDGQHRVEAAKRLNKIVYYIVSDTTPDRVDQQVSEVNNSQRGWCLSDYVKHYASRGDGRYAAVITLQEQTGWSATICLHWLGAVVGGRSRNAVKRGNSKTINPDSERLMLVPIALAICEHLKDNKLASVAAAERFHSALTQFLELPGMDHKRVINQFQRYGYLMGTRGTRRAYAELICQVWNYRKVGGIRYRIDEYGGNINYIQIGDNDE